MDKVATYVADINDSLLNGEGVYAIGIVDIPAIESNFVALSAFESGPPTEAQLSAMASANANPIKMSGEAKQILTGPVLIPDKDIIRWDEQSGFYNIRFTKESIAKIAAKFMKTFSQGRTTDQHESPLGGNTVTEWWIVEDPARDKSAVLGLDVPAGTLMCSMHIADKTYWDEYIATGKRKGFSIEAWLSYIPLEIHEARNEEKSGQNLSGIPQLAEQKSIINKRRMKKNFLQRIGLAILAALGNSNALLGMYVLEDGTNIEIDDETKDAFVLDAEGNRGDKVPDGTYKTQDGTMEITIVEGKATEEKAVEAAPSTEAAAANPAEESTGDESGNSNLSVIRCRILTPTEAKLAIEKKGSEKLGILVDDKNTLLFVEVSTGEVFNVDEYGYKAGYVETGSYTLANGKTMSVTAETRTVMGWDNVEYSFTASVINWSASTLSIEDLLPWVAEQASNMDEALRKIDANMKAAKLNHETKMEGLNAELSGLTAKLEKANDTIKALEAKLAATANVDDNGGDQRTDADNDDIPARLQKYRQMCANYKVAEDMINSLK